MRFQSHSGDLVPSHLKAVRVTVALADNTAATLCDIPTGKQCMGVVIQKFIGASGTTVESYNLAMTSSTVVITPQITSNSSGTAEILILFSR